LTTEVFMKVIEKIKQMQDLAEHVRRSGKIIGFVPTMGYLHEGHLALVRKAREMADIVVVSIFVNPIQFGPKEDLDKYPRDFQRDSNLLEKESADIIFFPDGKEMYPENYSTYVQVRGLEDHLCGLSRKGHFVGVATVVAKLFNIVKPHFAVFGQKDYQQLKIIERMVKDLNMDLQIVSYPTVREPDGLAMSSRNTYLSREERERALSIYRAIKRVEELFKEGERDAGLLRGEAEKIFNAEQDIEIEYITISDAETLGEISRIEGRAVLAIACRIGRTRLIDNTILMEG